MIPNKVGLYGDDDFCMAFAPVCSPETSPVKETDPNDLHSPSEMDRRYIGECGTDRSIYNEALIFNI